MPLNHIRDADCDVEEWRSGVRTRMYVSAVTGARQLTVFEQWCDPGHGAPAHHHAVEEILRVITGTAIIHVGDQRAEVGTGECVIVPAGAEHGFSNTGQGILHTQAILASPIFEAEYLDTGETSRRWNP